MRTVISRPRPVPGILAGIPAELREPLSAYAHALRDADDARRALTLAAVHSRLRMHDLEGLARKLG